MANLDFIKKLYNGKNCYSDHMTEDERNILKIESNVEAIVRDLLERNKIVFLTGNPGDGKTYIIRNLDSIIKENKIFTETDLNNVKNFRETADAIVSLYKQNKPGIIAVNEYPFIQLCKEIKNIDSAIADEIFENKKMIITYNISKTISGKTVVIDLNERNILSPERGLIPELYEKFIKLLTEDNSNEKIIQYNLKACTNESVKRQILEILELAAANSEHFAIRDILGTFAFMFTAGLSEKYLDIPYYSALFEGTNDLLKTIQAFDPIHLSSPELDERLWNGEITGGWLISRPDKWPNSKEFDEDIEGAIECFKNIKRKFFFENDQGYQLLNTQPNEIKKISETFISFENNNKKIKEKIIRSINKLFNPNSNDKKQLLIWTTHKYDVSLETSAAVSSRYIDSSDLEILMPRPSDWLQNMEYIPNHIILKPRNSDKPVLYMDIDFLQTLNEIENGYPVELLSSKYELAASKFLQELNNYNLADENEDGEIIIASRRKSYRQTVCIQNNKYNFEEE